jgi:uncharacterized protein YjiS (DUF1127 family)
VVTRILGQISKAWARWNHRRLTIRALSELSDWQLRDIGLTRDEIPQVVDAALNKQSLGERSVAVSRIWPAESVPGDVSLSQPEPESKLAA